MSKKLLQPGDLIPEFSLYDSEHKLHSIGPDQGKKRLIYFYPKNNTRKCTEQSCSFRDWQVDFIDAGYEVIGISSDSIESHAGFKEKHQLNFLLLSDLKLKVAKLFGATSFFGLIPKRVTYLIDEKGVIQHMHDALLEGEEHVENALQFVKK